MKKSFIILILLTIGSVQRMFCADLVIVINTLECSNYYRSAYLLTDLKKNFNVKFIFPEYEQKIAVKYLDQKFELQWKEYNIQYNDSLFDLYRKNLTSECVYFPDNAKRPLFSFPLSQLLFSFNILKSIPSNIKTDTIPISPEFLLTNDISLTFDSVYAYMLDAQFGYLLKLNKSSFQQHVLFLPDKFKYENILPVVLSEEEIKNSSSIEKELVDERSFIKKEISFEHITYHRNKLYIKSSVDFYKKGEENRNSIVSRKFIMVLDTGDLDLIESIPLINGDEFYHSYGPVFVTDDYLFLPIGFPRESSLRKDKKYILGKFKQNGKSLDLVAYDENNILPEEHQRLNLNYNFLNYMPYNNYFTFPYTKRIFDVNGTGFDIKLLPKLDTLAGSKIPDVRTNYMMLAMSVEGSVTNFILKFDDGKVKLFSYDFSNNLPFNQIELPIKIKGVWPNEDSFKFISINSFIHINIRNQVMVKYYW